MKTDPIAIPGLRSTRDRPHPAAGFTLVEVLLAVMVAAMAMVAVSGTFLGTLRARHEIDDLSQSTEAGQRILTLLERDLRGLWHHNVKNNAVLHGRNMDIAGFDADRIDFLTTTDSVGGVLGDTDQLVYPSICEVGYWLRENQQIPGLLELWRREDPLVDRDLITGGRMQLVSDRIRSFNLTYYETLGADAEPTDEWNSSLADTLPRRMKVEFTIDRPLANRNEVSNAEVEDFDLARKTYVRHIVFDRRYTNILQAGVAMMPLLPRRPQPDQGEGGGPMGGEGGEGDPSGLVGGGPGGGGPGGGGPGGARGGRGGAGADGGSPFGAGRGGSGRGGQGRGGDLGDLGGLGDLLRGGSGRGGGGLFGGGGGGGR